MNELKETLTKWTGAITKTSGELIKTTKLSVSLATEEENLKALYVEIGKKVHEIYAYGGSLGSFFDEKYKAILTQENKVKDIRNQLDAAKGAQTCPGCRKSVNRDVEFCPKCGYKMSGARVEAPEPVPSMEPTLEQPVTSKKICRACGKENEPQDRFCLSCGRMM